MTRSKEKTRQRIFKLKVTLDGIEPAIWRRLLLPSNVTLKKLHAVLQEAMGWTNSHLHEFRIRDRRFGDLEIDEDEEGDLEDERKVNLDGLVAKGQSLLYAYDFGDGWEHEVLVEDVLMPDERLRYPLCIAGARACPLEDVGGIPGYEEFIEVVTDEDHDEHDNMLRWCGGFFDPEGFDANAVNRRLWESKGLR